MEKKLSAEEVLKNKVGSFGLFWQLEGVKEAGGKILSAMEEYASQFRGEAVSDAVEWISVEDRLPEINEPLIGYNDEGVREVWIENYEATALAFDPEIGVFKAKINKRFNWSEVGKSYVNGCVNVTHWMPLPPPPKNINQ